MDEQMIRAAREIDAVPILPRDCDGGLVDLAAEAAGFHPDERIGIVEDEQDNAAMIARDLGSLMRRWFDMDMTEAGGPYKWDIVNKLLQSALSVIDDMREND